MTEQEAFRFKHAHLEKERRDRLRAANRCIASAKHGPVFKGGRCFVCWMRKKMPGWGTREAAHQ